MTSEEFSFDDFQSDLHAPKTRKPRTPNREGGTGTRALNKGLRTMRENLETLIFAGNNVFMMGSKYASYALSNDEVKALSQALVLELNANPRLARMVAGLGAASPHIALVQCLAGIGISRYVMYTQEKNGRNAPSNPLAGTRIFSTAENGHAPEPVATPIPAESEATGEPIRAVQW